MLFGIIIPELPITITLEPQNSAHVYSGHCSENKTLFPSVLTKIRIYPRRKSPENEKYPICCSILNSSSCCFSPILLFLFLSFLSFLSFSLFVYWEMFFSFGICIFMDCLPFCTNPFSLRCVIKFRNGQSCLPP